jgi:hypothetical protein
VQRERFGSFDRTVRQRPEATASMRLQASSTRNRETGASKQISSKTSCRLAKVVPTFEKDVPCGKPTKQFWSPAKATRLNKMAQKATQQVSFVHPLMTWYFSLTYSSLIYFPIQTWGSAAMSPYYMYHPITYSGLGTIILYLLIHWSSSHVREICNPKWPLCIRILLNNQIVRFKSRWLASGIILTSGTKWLVRSIVFRRMLIVQMLLVHQPLREQNDLWDLLFLEGCW